jgi:hypothetical protein
MAYHPKMDNPITRVFPDFADELLKIDPRLSIVPNPNRPKIANIKLDGTDICPIPAYEIREHTDPGYTIEMPNGSVMKHRSKEEAIALVMHTLEIIKKPENADAFFGRNGY